MDAIKNCCESMESGEQKKIVKKLFVFRTQQMRCSRCFLHVTISHIAHLVRESAK